jgi:O-antigen/teichoic acid export membrane protein
VTATGPNQPGTAASIGQIANVVPSLGRNSAARFAADIFGMGFGVIVGVVTARFLGPHGKGLFSSLNLLSALVMHASSLGLGDAVAVFAGRRGITMQRAISATIGATLVMTVVAVAVFWVLAVGAFRTDWHEVRPAAALCAASLVLWLPAYMGALILNAREQVGAGSLVLLTINACTALGLIAFVVVADWGLAGGMGATVFSGGVGLVLAVVLLARSGLSLRPTWDTRYLAPAARYGVAVAASYVVTAMLMRIDLLFTYAIAGSGPAGQYSVALTAGTVVGLLPMAIATAVFPRLPKLDPRAAEELTAKSVRIATAAALGGALVLVAVIPPGVPLVFGRDFGPAVVPALVLLISSMLWSIEFVLCRAAAARGHAGLLVQSFGISLAVMCGLDLVLIGSFGIKGASLAATVGPLVGLAWALWRHRRSTWWSAPLRTFVPGVADFTALLGEARRVIPVPGRTR